MKRIYCLFFAIVNCCSAYGEFVRIDPETPFFSKPDITSPIIYVAPERYDLEILETERKYIQDKSSSQGRWHPITIYTDFHRVRLNDRVSAWVSEEYLYSIEQQVPVPRAIPKSTYSNSFALSCLALLFFLFVAFRMGWHRALFTACDIAAVKFVVISLVILILLRLSLLFLTLYFAGNLISHPIDELDYFKIGKDIVDGVISPNWRFTIGLPLLYVPFIVGLNAKTYFEIVHEISVFNSVGVGSICQVLIFFIIQKVSRSTRKAFLTVLILSVVPFVYFPIEYHSFADSQKQVFKAIVSLPEFNVGSYRLYYIFNWMGFNGLSDMSSACIILCCILLALHGTYSRKKTALIAGLFALACLTRIANIFFSPLIAYVLCNSIKLKRLCAKEYLVMIGLGLGVFSLLFSPQFIINAQSYGGWFEFPYVLHENRANEGFRLTDFLSGTLFLINTNYIYMVMGAAGLLFIRDYRLKRFFIFWGLPLIIFYAGYPVVGASPIRFILPVYGGILGAFVCCEVWYGVSRKTALVMLGAVGASFILVSPTFRFTPPHSLNMERWLPGSYVVQFMNVGLPIIVLGLSFWAIRRKRKLGYFSLVLFGLYYVGSGYMIMLIYVAMTLWAAITAVLEIRKSLSFQCSELEK